MGSYGAVPVDAVLGSMYTSHEACMCHVELQTVEERANVPYKW